MKEFNEKPASDALGLTRRGLIALMSVLSACNTTAGAGEDISDTGQAIGHSAKKNTP